MDAYRKTNPIMTVTGDDRFTDPHIKLFADSATGEPRVYLYCGKDYSEKRFELRHWYVLQSADMVHWTAKKALDSGDTFLGADSTDCWACDAVQSPYDGKYYLYYSYGGSCTGVAVSDTPEGPFRDAHDMRPLLPESLSPTTEYDPDVWLPDNPKSDRPWIVFGSPREVRPEADDYWAVQLREDMTSIDETTLRKIPVWRGENDPSEIDVVDKSDQPEIFRRNGVYYLYWAGRYATSQSLLGPYVFRGNLGHNQGPYQDGRVFIDHGSFLQWRGQWFYTVSHGQDSIFHRKVYLLYLHFCRDGSLMVDPFIREHGVGQYDAGWERVEAEWFMTAEEGLEKIQISEDGAPYAFGVRNESGRHTLSYPNMYNLPARADITLRVLAEEAGTRVAVYAVDGPDAAPCLLAEAADIPVGEAVTLTLPTQMPAREKTDIHVALTGKITLDWFRFSVEEKK